MSIIQVISTPEFILEPLASRASLSLNVKTVRVKGWVVSGILASDAELVVQTSRRSVLPSKVQTSIIEDPGMNEAFYDRILLTSGFLIVQNQTVFLDIGSTDVFFTYGIWNGHETNEDISNIVYSESAGITIDNLSIGDRLYRFSEAPLIIKIEGIHALTVFDIDITITTTNYTFIISVVGTRSSGITFLSWANWNEPISIRQRWGTTVHTSVNNTEARQTLKDRPAREMDYTSLYSGALQVQQAWGLMQALAEAQQYLPLICDASFITASATSNFIVCDTTTRNFQIGYYAVLCHMNVFGSVGYGTDQPTVTYFPMRIQAITATRLSFFGVLPETFNTGDVAFPAIYSELEFKGVDHTIFGFDKGTLSIKINEVYGETTLPAANLSYSPTVYDTYPDLEWAINWTEQPLISMSRPAKVQKSGRYIVYDLLTDKSRTTLKFLTSALSRADTWELRGKLSYMMGQFKVFWVKSPLDILAVGATQSSTKISINSNVGDSNIVKIKGLYLENEAGQFEFLMGGMVETAGVWEFVYTNTVTVTSVTIIKQAFLMRSSKDDFNMTWFSLACADIGMDLIEVTEAYV